jgi:hypothetical protein
VNLNYLGKLLVIAGAAFVFVGVILLAFDKIPLLGRLPGDIVVKKKNFTFYFPVATSIIISIVLSIAFYLLSHFRK